MTTDEQPTWRNIAATGILVFGIALAGCLVAFSLWIQDLAAPQVAILGSGNRLSLLVTDGPARLLLATGDDPIAFENALTQVRPIFARRVDVLLVAGDDRTLLVPLAARADPRVRLTTALASLPPSAEAEAFGRISAFAGPRRIRLSPSVTVTVETALPVGAGAATTFPAWRATIVRGQTRVVVLSDGSAAALFPPSEPASVLVVAGDDPGTGWTLAPAVALVANSGAISGPELRAGFAESRRQPAWGYRVFPGEALRLRFVAGGLALPSDAAQPISATPPAPIAAARAPADQARAAFARANSSLTAVSRSGSAMRSTPVRAMARATASVFA
jgi:hypothetical protein